MIPRLRRRERVVVDTGAIMAVVAYRSKALPPVFEKARREDDLVISSIILMQCARQGDKRKCPLDRDEIVSKVRELCPDVVEIAVLPLEELRGKYGMRDESDLEVLYSADMLDADILIASDDDFYDPRRPVRGIRARILRPMEYLRGRRRHGIKYLRSGLGPAPHRPWDGCARGIRPYRRRGVVRRPLRCLLSSQRIRRRTGVPAMVADPILDLASTELRASEVALVVRRILATGRSAYVDGDTGWLVASGGPGDASREAAAAVDAFLAAGGFESRAGSWLAEGYSRAGNDLRGGWYDDL